MTQTAERLFTARAELGLLDPPGTNPLARIPFSEDASAAHRQVALRAAEEAMVLLKNTGVLPLTQAPARVAVVGPTAALLSSLEGNYNGTSLHAVYPVDGIARQFPGAQIHYAQGSTLAAGFTIPVPRTAFAQGLRAEFFATPDWTGQPVATLTEPDIQHNWRDAAPVPEVHTHDYSVRWTGTLQAPAPGKYTFIVQGGENFPYSPKESYRFAFDGKELSAGSLSGAKLNMGHFTFAAGASPTAPPVMVGSTPARIEIDFADTQPHQFQLSYSHSGDLAGGGVTLKWDAPAQAQLDEAVAAARQSDLVVAFVGLSPQLEGEEMPIKIEGFLGGDRTSISLPAAQQHLLEAVAASGKPVIVVCLSGSAIALTWAQQHAAAVLQAWYPGVEGGTAIARTLAGLNNPAGRLPLTFYSSTEDLPAFTDYSLKNRTYRYYTGKPLWGFGYGLSYSSFSYNPITLSTASLAAGQPLTATVTVTNTSSRAGDEVVEAYLKTPQPSGPIHSLVGFERVHLDPGQAHQVAITIPPRSLSTVDDQGQRSIHPGVYELSLGEGQPGTELKSSQVSFNILGTVALPK